MFDFRGLEKMFLGMVVALIIFVPLGAWKATEIICWLWERIANG
jgi:threonine/homoserine efflux transporter RhtA